MTAALDAIRVLMLEDQEADATLVEHELRKGFPECTVRCVDGREPFLEALEAFVPQLILSDHRLGQFSGLHALQLAKSQAPETPFLFVTGTIDDETGARYLQAGAWDYVLKDRLGQLVPAVKLALELQASREALRRAQEQLLISQKMDTLGRLTGAVAHDYNNLLTAILGYSSLVMSTLPPGDPRRPDLEQVMNAGELAADLSMQLLAFSRKEDVSLRRMSVNDVVTNTGRLLRRLIGSAVRFDTSLAPELPAVLCSAGQLQQVLINLAINARDAMPHGGHLTMETAVDEDQIRIRVRDTGVGMTPEVQARMFDPFFTTKAEGQGTGLGLATVSAIVSAAGGRITVDTQEGRGTTVALFLPMAAGDTQPQAAPEETFDDLAGTETVLITESDVAVRALAGRILQQYGYTAIQAASGPEAVRAAATSMEVDLLLTDASMPPGGCPWLDEIRRHHPDARVIGLLKPFQPRTLVRSVRNELNRLAVRH